MIRIDELVIQIPGLGEEEARRLAAAVAVRLGALASEMTQSGQIPYLDVTLNLDGALPQTQMAELIAQGILSKIKMATL